MIHRYVIPLALLLGGTACSPSNSVLISESAMGTDYPFTVKEGRLECRNMAITLTAEGKQYAVNGTAKSRGYADIDSIWKANPAIPGTKINISSVIQKGLELCK